MEKILNHLYLGTCDAITVRSFKKPALLVAVSAFSMLAVHAQTFLIGGPSNLNDGNFDDGSSTFETYNSSNSYPVYRDIGSLGVASESAAKGTPDWSVTSPYSVSSGFISGGVQGPVTNVPPTQPIVLTEEDDQHVSISSEAPLNYTVNTGDVLTLTAYLANGRYNPPVASAVTIVPTFNIGVDSDAPTTGYGGDTLPGVFNLDTFTYVVPLSENGEALNSISLTLIDGGTGTENYLDDITLSAVPEPSVWAMMLMVAASFLGLRRLGRQTS